MPPLRLARSLGRLSAACVESPATTARLSGLVSDINACAQSAEKLQAADLIKLKAPYHLGQIAILPLRVLAAAGMTLPDVSPDETTTQNLASAIAHVLIPCKLKAHDPQLPSGMRVSHGKALLPWRHQSEPGGYVRHACMVPANTCIVSRPFLMAAHDQNLLSLRPHV